MGASITLAGESLIAQKHAARETLDVQRFVFANVPGLDHSAPVDRAAGKPASARIVYAAEIPDNNAGFVNPNQVVYSLQVGSDVGDWDFNWIGLETAEGVLFAVAYVPLQQKRRNIPPLQVGNNITRNFLVAYDGAQALTGITIDASTWQHDFTVRLAGIDERERRSNRDVYGRATFFADSLQLVKTAGSYQLKPGLAYVEGIRLEKSVSSPVVPPALPATAWLEVWLQRELSDVVTNWKVVWGNDLVDYSDSLGARHYLVPLADLPSSSIINDRRSFQPISGALIEHFAARNGDYVGLRARSTTKDDVKLGNLPNAKSDDPTTDSSEILATTKAVRQSILQVNYEHVGQITHFACTNAPAGWLKCNGAAVSRTAYKELFDRIGTTWGEGDGVTTFNLPDARGEFLRGWDDGRGVDVARDFASGQGSQNAAHIHTGSIGSAGSHAHNIRSWIAMGFDSTGGSLVSGVDSGSGGRQQPDSDVGTLAAGAHVHTLTINSSGGSEARSRNIAVLVCIKY